MIGALSRVGRDLPAFGLGEAVGQVGETDAQQSPGRGGCSRPAASSAPGARRWWMMRPVRGSIIVTTVALGPPIGVTSSPAAQIRPALWVTVLMSTA